MFVSLTPAISSMTTLLFEIMETRYVFFVKH